MKIVRHSEHEQTIKEYMRHDRLTVYGMRKGAAVKCTSDTADCALIVPVLKRGEWSAGKVFDSYFHWANAGDEYVGRCVRGIGPNQRDFALLPPHWKDGVSGDGDDNDGDGGAMENPFIKKGMELCSCNILKKHSNSMQGPLLLYLASIVYHAEWCQQHPVLKDLPVLTDLPLLIELKKIDNIGPQ